MTWLCFQNLESVIRARIPSITSTINNSIDELESELDHLGRPIAVDAGVSSLFLSQSFLADIHFILSVWLMFCALGPIIHHLGTLSCIWQDIQRASGWRVIISTLLPKLQKYNIWIRKLYCKPFLKSIAIYSSCSLLILSTSYIYIYIYIYRLWSSILKG
jgi:hypothetical protein